MNLASHGETSTDVGAIFETTSTLASGFLAAWDRAWNDHDAHLLGDLHTSDAITVNRFGTLVAGRSSTEKALGFLHSPKGPFGQSRFPSLKLLEGRRVAPDVMIVQASWQNPVMHPDGSISETAWNDMIMTFVLVHDGVCWRASQVDAHNVEKMHLPFSNPGQKS
jgi:hypothetical protein